MGFRNQFDAAVAKNPDEIAGEYAVHLVAAFLPKPLRFLGQKKVFRQTPSGIIGYNSFLGGLIKAGHFRVERGESVDGTDVTKIIYNNPKNPFFIRPLTDEVRETSPGHFLGRGMVKVGKMARNVFWFTVTKEP